MNINIRKGHDGWEATTDIEMGNGRIIRISTGKGRGGMRTNAQVWKLGVGGTMSFEMFGDFSRCIATSTSRCTENLVREAHAKALRLNADIVAQAEAFYAAKAVPAGASMV